MSSHTCKSCGITEPNNKSARVMVKRFTWIDDGKTDGKITVGG